METVKEFAGETTIHGLPQVYKHESKVYRTAWLLLLAIMVAVFSYEGYKAVKMYLERPTATKILYEIAEAFPPVAICTNDWMSLKKVRDAGFTGIEDQSYLFGALCRNVHRPSHLPTFDKAGMVDYKAATKNKLKSAQKAYGSYENLLKTLAYNFSEVATATCNACKQRGPIKASNILKEEGMCWLLEPGEVMQPTTRQFRLPALIIDMKFPVAAVEDDVQQHAGAEDDENLENVPTKAGLSEKSFFNIHLADAAMDTTSVGQARASPGEWTLIDASLTRLTKSQRDCNDTKGHTQGVCDAECFDELERYCRCTCHAFYGELGGGAWNPKNLTAVDYNRPEEVCVWTDPYAEESCDYGCWRMDRKSMNEEGAMCNRCKPPCESTDVSISSFGHRNLPMNVDMRIEVRMKNLFRYLHYIEYDSYTLSHVISDFGGLSGLFLGASAISMAHVIFFCLHACCKTAKDHGPALNVPTLPRKKNSISATLLYF